MADSNNDFKNEIRRTVERINEASRKGNIEALKHFCHKNVVIVPPGFIQRAEGRDTYLKSVEDFCATGNSLNIQAHSAALKVKNTQKPTFFS